MTTNIEYCSPHQSRLLKVVGFDWPVDAYYTTEDAPDNHLWFTRSEPENFNDGSHGELTMSAPTLDRIAQWFREACGVDIVISPRFNNVGERTGYLWRWAQRTDVTDPKVYSRYEKALSAAIDTVLKPFEVRNHHQPVPEEIDPEQCVFYLGQSLCSFRDPKITYARPNVLCTICKGHKSCQNYKPNEQQK